MDPLTLASLGLGAIGGISKFIFGDKQSKLADQINPNYAAYQKSPYASQQLGIATNLFNGRMEGAGAMERNIAGAQANQMANIGRNATDSSTALALGSAAQGQANDAYGNLAIKEAQNKYNLLDNLNAAYATNIREGDKVNQSLLNKYQIDTQTQNQLRDAGAKNMFGGLGDLTSLGIMGGTYGSMGGKKKQPYNDYGFNSLPANYLNTGV